MTEKLIRDRIPEIAARNGRPVNVRTASAAELPELLRTKLGEEYLEVLSAGPEGLLEELADLIEVAYALAQAHGHSGTALDVARSLKRYQRGSFIRGIVLRTD